MAFGFMVDHLFQDNHLASQGLYYPKNGGDSFPVRVIFRQPDETISLGGFDAQARVMTIDLRVSEVSQPVIGDRVQVNSILYEITATPKNDPLNLIWSCGVRPA